MIIEGFTPSPSRHRTMASTHQDRLAELVQELTDCALDVAVWSVDAARRDADEHEDPLATVARAMVLVRHQDR